jgi:ABC-type amino acid transport system permease subunit
MENTPFSQLYEFIVSVLWGGVIGILYEFCGFLRIRGKKWIVAVSDLVFWFLTGISTFVFLLIINGGEPRGFMLLGTAGGAVLIRMTAGTALHNVKLSAEKRLMIKKAKKRSIKTIKAKDIKNKK